MKKHHLDEYIEKLKQWPKYEIDLIPCLLMIFEEIKRIDENHESLPDWVHDYNG